MSTVLDPRTSIAGDLLAGCRILDGERLTDAFGHLSARTPQGEVLLTSRIGPGLVHEPDQILRLSLDGEVIDGDRDLVPGEAPLHLGMLRGRPDAGAVCRFHGPACFAFSTLGKPLPATTGLALMLGAAVPVHGTSSTVTTLEGAERCADTLGDAGGVLLQGFGAVTVGRTIAEAVVRATFLERAAAAVLAVRGAGEPHVYSAEQAAAFAARTAVIDEQVTRAWTYLCDKWSNGRR